MSYRYLFIHYEPLCSSSCGFGGDYPPIGSALKKSPTPHLLISGSLEKIENVKDYEFGKDLIRNVFGISFFGYYLNPKPLYLKNHYIASLQIY